METSATPQQQQQQPIYVDLLAECTDSSLKSAHDRSVVLEPTRVFFRKHRNSEPMRLKGTGTRHFYIIDSGAIDSPACIHYTRSNEMFIVSNGLRVIFQEKQGVFLLEAKLDGDTNRVLRYVMSQVDGLGETRELASGLDFSAIWKGSMIKAFGEYKERPGFVLKENKLQEAYTRQIKAKLGGNCDVAAALKQRFLGASSSSSPSSPLTAPVHPPPPPPQKQQPRAAVAALPALATADLHQHQYQQFLRMQQQQQDFALSSQPPAPQHLHLLPPKFAPLSPPPLAAASPSSLPPYFAVQFPPRPTTASMSNFSVFTPPTPKASSLLFQPLPMPLEPSKRIRVEDNSKTATTKKRLASSHQVLIWKTLLRSVVLDFEHPQYETWNRDDAFEQVVEEVMKESSSLFAPAINYGIYLYFKGRFPQALQHFNQMDHQQQLLPAADANLLCRWRARAYMKTGDYVQAEQLMLKVIDYFERNNSQAEVSSSYSDLAWVYHDRANVQEDRQQLAEKSVNLFVKAIKLRQNDSSNDDADSMRLMADDYYGMGLMLSLFPNHLQNTQRAFEIAQDMANMVYGNDNARGEESSSLVMSRMKRGLAIALMRQAQLAEPIETKLALFARAADLLQRAVDIRIQVYGNELHPQVANLKSFQANVRRLQTGMQDDAQAVRWQREAETIWDQAGVSKNHAWRQLPPEIATICLAPVDFKLEVLFDDRPPPTAASESKQKKQTLNPCDMDVTDVLLSFKRN